MNIRKKTFRTARAIGRRIRGIPAPGGVDFGDLRRTTPLSESFGADRGVPVDRHYIEVFLATHRADVKGHVLEVYDDSYARQFGDDQVAHCDVWHHAGGNPRATIVGDLVDAPHVASGQFDCIILTQTLQYLTDPLQGLHTLNRLLRTGGVLLLTVPGITPVAVKSAWGDRWFWNFTGVGMLRLLQESFPRAEASVVRYGNVLSATAFLQGLAASELTSDELQQNDPSFQVTIAARVRKGSAGT